MATQQAVPVETAGSPQAEPPADPAGDPAARADSPVTPRAGLSPDSEGPGTPPPGPSASAGTGSSAPPLEDVIAWQEEIFSARQPESRRMAEKAATALAGGVTSSWQITRPQPVWLSHGEGSKVYDVDGNEYVDLHGGYGASLAGHGHPGVVRGRPGPGTPRPPVRPAAPQCHRRRRETDPPVRPAAVALRQLRH